MKLWRWLLVVLPVLLLAMGGVAAWAYVHQGYPRAVYYQLLSVTINQQSVLIDEWIDPTARRVRWEQRGLGSAGWSLVREDRLYGMAASGSIQSESVGSAQRRSLADLYQGLQSDGFAGLGTRLLAERASGITRVVINGAPALCFATAFNTYFGTDGSLCVDARTYLPRSLTSITADGLSDVTRYSHSRRVAPYTLPADFFEPPHPQPSPWDLLSGWLKDHLH